jgi:hypothetical protein
MTVTCNTKQSTCNKTGKFCEEISQQFEELVAMTNQLNEKNLDCEAMETNQAIESLYATLGSITYDQPFRNLLRSCTRTLPILVK